MQFSELLKIPKNYFSHLNFTQFQSSWPYPAEFQTPSLHYKLAERASVKLRVLAKDVVPRLPDNQSPQASAWHVSTSIFNSSSCWPFSPCDTSTLSSFN